MTGVQTCALPIYEGKRYDCGSKEGFLEANVELALAHPQLGAGFRQFLTNLNL